MKEEEEEEVDGRRWWWWRKMLALPLQFNYYVKLNRLFLFGPFPLSFLYFISYILALHIHFLPFNSLLYPLQQIIPVNNAHTPTKHCLLSHPQTMVQMRRQPSTELLVGCLLLQLFTLTISSTAPALQTNSYWPSGYSHHIVSARLNKMVIRLLFIRVFWWTFEAMAKKERTWRWSNICALLQNDP